ncbi:peptidyl-prolyl cis-trans isomerase [Neisseria sp. CCUG12390]|uniref:peptidylprolyl isomerase n=1 Tax=Neisseria sp. CCUG12390 TaxID=3392035 RepID=UPI003A0FD87E
MKHQTAVAGIVAAAIAGFAIAKAPEIPAGRIDSMVKEVLRQADQNPNQTSKPDGAAIRADVVRQLQTFEVLKNEALKAGLDKDPEVRNQFQTMEAQFYATQYAQYLERNTTVTDNDLHKIYEQQTRMIKLQQVSFDSEQQARAAQELLLKGLSFEELMKRYPNPEQAFNEFIMPQQLPPEIAEVIEPMNRGDVTHNPLKLQDKFYLFKLSAVERNPEAQPFELVRNQLAQQAKQQKVRRQIDELLEANGISH